ncbi:uncharacterized protein [Montipora foliosa]|uniref:uncharacterized protein n=1 Tax=Montipora foliosa TaxID=591990 RepID=UPI0035F0FAC4
MLDGVEEISGLEQKVLGIRWNPLKDVFMFDLTEIASYARDLQPTKRNVVTVAAKFYDPFGFLSPIIIEFTLFFQELCKTKIGWDDSLNGNVLKMWHKLLNGLESVTALSLPRCYFQGVQEKVGEEREWKQFVRNRVNEIRNLVPASRWQQYNGKDNPADIPSRGLSPVELSRCPLWKEGPKWLICFTEDTKNVFNSTHIPEECFVEVRTEEKVKCQTSSLFLASTEPCGIAQIMRAEDISDLQRLLRVTALVLKFVRTMKSSLKKDIPSPSESAAQDIMVNAETIWIKEVQKSLSKNPKFEIWRKRFGIFTDSQGIMRCNGRLSKADLPPSIKYPILLDKDHHITSLIVQDSHKRVMHGGVKLTLTELRALVLILRALSMSTIILVPRRKYGSVFTRAALPGLFI